MDLENLCGQVKELSREVGDFILEEQKKITSSSVTAKGKQNYVTHVDTSSEKMLVEGLRLLIPGSGFIAEEGTAGQKGEKYQWIIDPIDGTTNFIHGLPPFAISIALMEDREIILGVVYELGFKEFFYAWKGSKAFMDDTEIHVSATPRVSDSLIATGFPYTYFDRLDPFMYSVRYFMQNSHGLRRLGSAATDLAYVACGRFEAFYEYGLSPWDVAAGTFIIQQAGGMACEFTGEDDWLFGGTIIAANSAMYDEFREVVKQIFVEQKKI